MAKPALNSIARRRTAHRATHDETDPGRLEGSTRCDPLRGRRRQSFRRSGDGEMRDDVRPSCSPTTQCDLELRPSSESADRGQHVDRRPSTASGSGGEPGAALVTAASDHCAAGPGTHSQPEPVRLGSAPVVRLERALAHGRAPQGVLDVRAWRCGAEPGTVGWQCRCTAARPPNGTGLLQDGSNVRSDQPVGPGRRTARPLVSWPDQTRTADRAPPETDRHADGHADRHADRSA